MREWVCNLDNESHTVNCRTMESDEIVRESWRGGTNDFQLIFKFEIYLAEKHHEILQTNRK